ncbi:MAG: MGMT family protein [Firmicutes bacterium]|nr:MGMT family protein [Bacillota bacterium]MCL1954283.1 MGMT family protein [Bacillota bacterium]
MSNQKSFFGKVYQVVQSIPKGKVSSYGSVASACGNPRMSRQVGWALHSNPNPNLIPCHRVVTKDGRMASGFAFGGSNIQKQLLIQEGVIFIGDLVDMERANYKPLFLV